jgi:DNA-directed RNA polymerase specialized sigma24 family protein
LAEINKLIDALDKNPPKQREILYLRFYGKLDYAGICSFMEITYKMARNQLSSAVTKLKTIISENK